MTFDDQLTRYFGTADISKIEPSAMSSAIERMKVDLGLASSSGARFALWCLLFMLGEAPDVDQTFEQCTERDLARQFMEMSEAETGTIPPG